ncbi:Tll0287-like domain-containing protein [Maribacter hydrothermalis]|uniref:Tll0287-like domain-containing protein n=1 Tax=Maribacter hydrothermalis TaxID=1836467 RepID=A0A1B7YZC2_9FLAO|nr:DUF3365 domain-containing protein [Maribacter hydrothermalis]APQ16076.1 hypothetical protein BTR34_01385 [Maribacter hydrothermalis]OBR35746.1 hypothetical protein A9200_11125 [Maribacter hydrothermalis]
MKKAFFLLATIFVFSCKDSPKVNDGNTIDRIDTIDTNKTSLINDSIFLEKGKNYAQSTQKILGKNLMASLQKNGAVGAVEFCNEKAYPLTDSMAVVHNAKIKRVSDKPRNANNQASENELEYIEFFKSKINNKESYEPIVENNNGKINYYSPIVTNTMCLNCHGIPETNIDPKVTQILNDRYPYDQATGYKENEVRGIWSITFNNEQNK